MIDLHALNVNKVYNGQFSNVHFIKQNWDNNYKNSTD